MAVQKPNFLSGNAQSRVVRETARRSAERAAGGTDSHGTASPRLGMTGGDTSGEAWTRAASSQTRVPAPKAASAGDIWARGSRYSGVGSNPAAVPSRPVSSAAASRGRVSLEPERGYSPGRERASRQYVKPPAAFYQAGKDDYRDTWAQGLTGTERRERKEDVHRRLAELAGQAGQARVDLDTDTLNQINGHMKTLRASIGEQTLGDRVNDTLSGSVQSYGAGMVNAVGTVANAFNDPAYYRRQITALQKRLEAGGYSDGRRFVRDTEEGRQRIRDSIREMADKAWRLERPTSFVNRTQRVADRMQDDSAKSIASAKEGAGALGQLAVDVGVAGTQMGMDALTAALTGGSSLVPMAVRSFGGGAQEARRSGADLDRQMLYGVGSAALSVGTEKISNIAKPFQKMFGRGAAETIAGSLVKRFGENGAVQLMQRLSKTAAGRIALSAIGEGGEEVVEDVLQPFLKRATFDPNARFDAGEAGNDFLVGAILGGLGGVPEAVGRIGSGSARNRAETGAGAEMRTPAGVDVPRSETGAQGVQEGPGTGPVQRDVIMEAATRGGRLEAEAAPVQQKAVPGTGTAVVADMSRFDRSILGNLNKARTYFVNYARNNFPTSVVNAETGKNIGISRTGIDKFLSGRINAEKYASGFHIPELVERARKVSSAKNYHQEKAGSIPTFEYFDSPIQIDGKDYTAHIRVKNSLVGDKYYGHTISELESIEIEPPARTSFPETPAVQPVNAIGGSVEGTRPLNSDSTITQPSDSVKPRGTDSLMEAIFSTQKRVDQAALTPEQFDRLADLNEQGTVGMDAAGRVYQVDPAEHIDRRSMDGVGGKGLNAFSFDHPELHGYFKRAAEALIADADLSMQFPAVRRYERGAQGRKVSQGAEVSAHLRQAMDETGLSRAQLIDAAKRIVEDHGQENAAAAKRVEIILDDMLENGWTAMTGKSVPPNQAYIDAKSRIAGSRAGEARESYIPPELDAVDDGGGVGDDGIGAADAGSLNSDYDRLQAQSEQFHKPGEDPARPVDVPKYDFDGNPVSQTASTVMGAKAIPDDVIPMIEQMVADGKLSYDPVTNAASEARARAKIQQNGFDGAMEEYRSAVRAGRTSPEIEILGQTLLNNAANARDGQKVAELLSLYQAGGTNLGQALQARKIMRKLSPEGQLYAIQRSVDNINNGKPAGRGAEVSEQEAAGAAGAVREALDEALAQLETMTGAYQNVVDAMHGAYRSGETGKPRSERWVDRLGADLARNAERRARPSKEKQSTVYETVLRDLSAAMADHVRKGPVRKGQERTVYDTISDMLNNRQEYAAAWQTAQNTLLEKYSNDPAMLEAFKEFNETSPLYGGIGPDSAMMKAVAQAALDQDLTVKDLVIRGTYDADALTNQIFDELVRRVSPQSDTDRAVLREAVQRYVQRKTESAEKYAFEYINGDINRVMREIGVKISNVIRSSPGSKATTANLISDILVQQYGVSADAAKSIAADITADFQKTVQEASRRKLEQIFKDRPARQQKGFQRKFEELANLGAFSGEFNEAAVRKVFELDQDGSVKISQDLIQKFLDQSDQAGRDAVMEEIVKDVAGQLPGSWGKIFDSMRYLAMLGNTRTHVRNMIGNAIFQPFTWGKNRIGGIGEAIAQRAGVDVERTKTWYGANPFRKMAREARAEYKDLADLLNNGSHYNEDRTGTKAIREYYNPFKNVKHLQKLADALDWSLGRLGRKNMSILEAEDNLFKTFIYGQTLADYLHANKVESIDAASPELLSKARNYAAQEALRNTFNDSNVVSDAVAQLGRARQSKNKLVKGVGYAVEGTLPFKRTPANVAVRAVEYSPVGGGVNLIDTIVKGAKGELTPADVSRKIDRIAAGLSGSALGFLGFLAARAGLVTGGDDEDEDQRNFDSLTGHQSYALETEDGTSYTLDWAAPASIPFFMGVELYNMAADGRLSQDDLGQALKNLGSPMLEMSMLQGLNDAFESVSYAKQHEDNALTAFLANAATGYFTQVFPTAGGQLERIGEDRRMTTYTDKNKDLATDTQYTLGKISQKVPGWDYNQIPYVDAWGREEETGDVWSRIFQNTASPGYLSNVDVSAVEQELQRIKDSTGDSGVFPDRAPKYFNVDKERKDLTAKEYQTYAKKRGQTALEVVGRMTVAKGYKALSDEQKAQAVKDVYSYADALGKMECSDYKPDSGSVAAGVMKSMLPPEVYILYKINSDRDGNGSTSGAESALTLMEMDGLTDKERGEAWSAFNNKGETEESRERKEEKNPFTGVLAGEYEPEEVVAAWGIFDGKGTKEKKYTQEQKKRDLQEELGLTPGEANELFALMKKAANG